MMSPVEKISSVNKREKRMSQYDYIKTYYSFPAKRGLVVKYDGKRGVVTGTNGPHVRVRLDGETLSKPYHPYDLKVAEVLK